MTASVTIEAATIEEAQQIALTSEVYDDPAKARFEIDEGNDWDRPYLPDPETYEAL